MMIRNKRNITIKYLVQLALFFLLIFSSIDANAARIKDIATIEGVTVVQVIGYGLVSGLNQTGDNQQTSYAVQSVTNMLKRFGLTVPSTNPRIRNVAAVMVTANIPTFMKKGSKVDVQVSSIGDASSLQGGILLMTPVSFADGGIVGSAQGSLSVGGYDYRSLGSVAGKNSVTSGRVPNGLILDSAINGNFIQNQIIKIILRDPDFTTATRISAAINAAPGLTNAATAMDGGTVQVQLPQGQNQGQVMTLISQIESLQVQSDPVARVVINERTGTVVVGGNVQLLPTVIAHGGLEISIQKQVIMSQPAPFTSYPNQKAETAVVGVDESMNPAVPLTYPGGSNVQELANALNLLKVSPRDLISIFQALKECGSLQGELIIQ
jgi:flagellar P-ring protein precursor FlgI